MTVLYAYDGASPFSLKAAKAHGAKLITGYIVGHPGGMDPIDRSRVRAIHKLGLGFLPNWERGAGYLVSCSRADGVAAGREAVAACRALGIPDDGSVACPFSWDVSIRPDQYAHCGTVADGIIEGLGGHYRFTAYGQGGLIDYLASTGRLQSEGWLSASSSFPGYDPKSPRVALVQRVGSPVSGTDQNVLTDPANVHAWWPAGSPYSKEVAVTITDSDAKKIARAMLDEPVTYDGTTQPVSVWLTHGDRYARAAHLAAKDAADKVTAVATVVNSLPPRVAQLQAAVVKLTPTTVNVAVDNEAVAAAVTAGFARKLGA